MTTYSAFVTALTGLTITGVTRRYTQPPASLNTADLPAQYPMLPSGDERPITMGQGGMPGAGQETQRIDLIIAYEPVAQNTNVNNFSGLLTLMDNARTAIKAMSRPTRGALSWSMRMGIATLAGVEYWVLVITFEGVG